MPQLHIHGHDIHLLHLQLLKETLALKHQHDLVDSRPDGALAEVNGKVGLLRRLVRVINTGETLNLTASSLLIDTPAVGLLAVLERRGDVDKVERPELLNDLLGLGAGRCVGGDWCGNDGGTALGELGGDETNAVHVLVAVVLAEAEFGGKLGADSIAEKERHGTATLLVQRDVEGTCNGVLATVDVSSQEDSESLLVAWRVGLAENAHDLGVGEPFRDVTTGSQTATELCRIHNQFSIHKENSRLG